MGNSPVVGVVSKNETEALFQKVPSRESVVAVI